MERYFRVNGEFVACMLEISSELDYIMEEGLNPDSMDIIERVNNRLAALIRELGKEDVA